MERSKWTPAPPNYPCSVYDDPRYLLAHRAADDPTFMQVIADLDRGNELARKEMMFLNADNASYFHDSKPQAFITAVEGTITLAATDKLLYPGGRTATPANYLTTTKRLRITVFGAFTTAVTPGNIGLENYYGTTDAGGTLLSSSGAVALTASKTNITCKIIAFFICALAGPAGSMKAIATLDTDSAGAILTGNGLTSPASAPAYVAIDTTAAQGLNTQIKRSGSTAETWATHEILWEALN